MEKLNKKEKHSHKLTNILKGIIFSIVMVAPFFSVITRCLYVVCNPNAKDSYSLVQSSEYTIDNTQQDFLLSNNFYYFQTNEALNYYQQVTIQVSNFSFMSTGFVSGHGNVITFSNYLNQNNHWLSIKYEDNFVSYLAYANTSNVITGVYSFTFQPKVDYDTNPYLTNISKIIFGENNQLDNAFEYSISQLKESSLYNWAENTAIYQGLYDMCIGMGTNDVIPLLLSYWALLTAIYIVFDIIIWSFTKITHFVSAD